MMPKPLRLLVLVSGSGTNLQALLDAEKAGQLGGREADQADKPGKGRATVVAVGSDRPGAFALQRAQNAGVPTFVVEPRRDLPKAARRAELSARLLDQARTYQADLIVLAGFLSILAGPLLEAYQGRIINLHPSLLPRFGGQGMYGEQVHLAVLASGETESGCTVHLVDEGTDTGPILLQKKVPILPGDSAATLAERIHGAEHVALVEAIEIVVNRTP